MVGGGGRESENSVCPRPLLQFLKFFQFLQFMSVRLRQFTLEGWDVELDNVVLRLVESFYKYSQR